MEDNTGTSPDEKRHLQDLINPLRLYDIRVPAGKFVFLWGLAIFPLAVMFVLLTATIIIIESVYRRASADYLGIIVWIFMLAWVTANVMITRRRLLQVGMSPMWVYVAVMPIINLPLFLYLLLKT